MKDEITFETFQTVDVRIGKILSVEIVPDTDKLLKLSVDVGENVPRTIVSGIREYVDDLSTLVGMSTPFVLNIPSKKVRGIVSHGMLFAISLPNSTDDGVGDRSGFSFLKPDRNVAPGSPLM